jgi:hypothetical protein
MISWTALRRRIRDAGQSGMTVRQLADLLQSGDPDTGALPVPAPKPSTAAQTPGAKAGPDDGADPSGAAPDGPTKADADTPPPVKVPAPVPDAANIARARAITGALRSHGLVRRVPGYDSWTYVASEHASIFFARLPPAPPVPTGTSKASEGEARGVSRKGAGDTGGREPVSLETAPAVGHVSGERAEKDAAVPMDVDEAGVDPATTGEEGKEVLLMPWHNHLGRVNRPYWHALVQRVLSVIVRNPGMTCALP